MDSATRWLASKTTPGAIALQVGGCEVVWVKRALSVCIYSLVSAERKRMKDNEERVAESTPMDIDF